MKKSTADVIQELAGSLQPVRRLNAPWVRALQWLSLVFGLSVIAITLFANLPAFVEETKGAVHLSAWLASMLTGIVAVVAAANISVPGRSRLWAVAPLPFLLLWLFFSGADCWGLDARPQGHSDHCFVFVLVVGAPLSAFLFWRLRRSAPLQPSLVALYGALGAAGLAAALLQFFHPFPITWFDLAAHLAAASILVAVGALAAPALRAQ